MKLVASATINAVARKTKTFFMEKCDELGEPSWKKAAIVVAAAGELPVFVSVVELFCRIALPQGREVREGSGQTKSFVVESWIPRIFLWCTTSSCLPTV